MGALQKGKPKEQSKLEEKENIEEKYEPKENELKIDLYPKNTPRYTFDKTPVSTLITKERCFRSFFKSKSVFSLY